MGRLAQKKCEEAPAEYEVRDISLREVAQLFGVAESAARRRAKGEGWIQGKSARLVEKKVSTVKALAEVNFESAQLPRIMRFTIERVAEERLQAEGLLASLDAALGSRAIEMGGRRQCRSSLKPWRGPERISRRRLRKRAPRSM